MNEQYKIILSIIKQYEDNILVNEKEGLCTIQYKLGYLEALKEIKLYLDYLEREKINDYTY